jgi:hypothetical protein
MAHTTQIKIIFLDFDCLSNITTDKMGRSKSRDEKKKLLQIRKIIFLICGIIMVTVSDYLKTVPLKSECYDKYFCLGHFTMVHYHEFKDSKLHFS